MAVATVEGSRVANAYKTLNEEVRLPATPATPTMYIPRLASNSTVRIGYGGERERSPKGLKTPA